MLNPLALAAMADDAAPTVRPEVSAVLGMPLYEAVRPTKLAAVIGHDRIKKRLEIMRKNPGWLGQVFWFVGNSASGKTTVARIIAAEIAKPFATIEIDAQDVTLDLLRDAEKSAYSRPLGGGGWAYVVNESHGLSSKVVSRLQTLLELPAIQRNTTWIFTTTGAGQQKLFDDKMDASPLLSRAKVFQFTMDDVTKEAFAQWVHDVATARGLNGQPMRAYREFAERHNWNMRAMLQDVESGVMAIA